jgi:DNA-binding transcriptional LysR family regulator
MTATPSRPLAHLAGAPPLSARQLAAVLALVEYRNFVAAAAFLGLSQPALTLTIQRLEASLGVDLFVRSTRSVTPTPAGREFAAMAERVLTDLKLGVRSLRELSEQRRGQVIVSCLVPLPMSAVVAEYRRSSPGVEIHLREGLQDDVREDVRAGVADFGVGDLFGLPDGFLTDSLGQQPHWVVMRDDNPLARRRQVEFGALKDTPLISFRTGSAARRLIDAAAAAQGFTLSHVVTVGLPFSLLNLVAAGVGIAVGPARMWPNDAFPGLVSRPLVKPRLTSEIGVMRLTGRDLSPAAAGLLRLVLERMRIKSV